MPENKSGFAMIEVTPATEKASTDKLFAEVARIRIYQAVAAPCLKAFAVGYPDSHVVTPENIICTDMKKGFNSLCGIITSKLGFANTITKYTKIS